MLRRFTEISDTTANDASPKKGKDRESHFLLKGGGPLDDKETMELEGKNIVITGGARGLGLSIAKACAKAGARVVIAGRSGTALNEATAEIQRLSGKSVLAVKCDVTKQDEVAHLFQIASREAGPIYGLICAAGIYGAIGPFESTSLEKWCEALEVNLVGVVRCIGAVIAQMKERRQGRIILFSGGGQGPVPRFSAYATSKGGIWRLAESLGAEFASSEVYLNAIAPGPVNTQFLEDLLAAGPELVGKEHYEKALRQKEEGGKSPEKAAELALYLLSSAGKLLYGKILSAHYDDFRNLGVSEKVSQSELFTMRRVVTPSGGTRY